MASRYESRDGVLVNVHTGLPPTPAEIKACDDASDAILAAESAFELALRKRFGSQASEWRYQTSRLPVDIRDLAMGYQSAVAAWRATWEVPDHA